MVKYYKVNRLLGAVHSRGYLPDASVWERTLRSMYLFEEGVGLEPDFNFRAFFRLKYIKSVTELLGTF